MRHERQRDDARGSGLPRTISATGVPGAANFAAT